MFAAQITFPNFSKSLTCKRCKRALRSAKSIQIGLGPVCAGKQSKTGGEDAMRKFDDEQDSTPLAEMLVMRRSGVGGDRVGRCVTNVPHLVIHHSPAGFEFGYSGSGPADLALNVCQVYLNNTGYTGKETKCYDGSCFSMAFALHQEFKREFIATSSILHGEIIPWRIIQEWFVDRMTDELVAQYASIGK